VKKYGKIGIVPCYCGGAARARPCSPGLRSLYLARSRRTGPRHVEFITTGLMWSLRCYRRLLQVCWEDKITNDSTQDTLQRKSTIVDTIKNRKLLLFGHICRTSDTRLVKSVVLGMTDGTRSRGRPPRRWSNDLEESMKQTMIKLSLCSRSPIDCHPSGFPTV